MLEPIINEDHGDEADPLNEYEVGITTTYYDVYTVKAPNESAAIALAKLEPCSASIHSDGEAFILSTNGEKNWGLT